MESRKIHDVKLRQTALAKLTLLLSAALFCISCGPQVIKGRPPFISISAMSLEGETLSAVFDIRNRNGVPMTIDMIDITVMVNQTELTRHNSDFSLEIGANSAESVDVEKFPDEFTRALLVSLESGEVNSLPFDLKGRVHTIEDGNLAFANKGHLYPVPGKPGKFRSAVTHAKELEREEPF